VRLAAKRLWCRALGHGVPWVTISALGLRYHLCPRCGNSVFEPTDFLPGRGRGGRAGDVVSLVVLLAGVGLAVVVLL
jgi:hypothetical protein